MGKEKNEKLNEMGDIMALRCECLDIQDRIDLMSSVLEKHSQVRRNLKETANLGISEEKIQWMIDQEKRLNDMFKKIDDLPTCKERV